MIIFVALVAALGIVPENIRAAAKKLQSFFTANLILIIMVGVGVDTNIIELAKAITPGNVVIALAIVIGAIIGSALCGIPGWLLPHRLCNYCWFVYGKPRRFRRPGSTWCL